MRMAYEQLNNERVELYRFEKVSTIKTKSHQPVSVKIDDSGILKKSLD